MGAVRLVMFGLSTSSFEADNNGTEGWFHGLSLPINGMATRKAYVCLFLQKVTLAKKEKRGGSKQTRIDKDASTVPIMILSR